MNVCKEYIQFTTAHAMKHFCKQIKKTHKFEHTLVQGRMEEKFGRFDSLQNWLETNYGKFGNTEA